MTTYFAFLQLFINILKETVGNEIHSENRNKIGIYENRKKRSGFQMNRTMKQFHEINCVFRQKNEANESERGNKIQCNKVGAE
jgi:formaldehyde-activating enzyme involved in methanogenesis